MKPLDYKYVRIVLQAICVISVLCQNSPVSAQEHLLKSVKIQKTKKQPIQDERVNSFAGGMQVISIDSTTKNLYNLQDLQQLISQQTPAFVKSFGINSMATLNFRGSSSAQSSVLWNGIPLNNAALGLADVSTLSVNTFDQINVLYGSSSAMLGSGNIGASILLEDKIVFSDSLKTHTQVGVELGSYKTGKIAFRESIHTSRFYLKAQLFGQSAQNDFSYTDLNNNKQQMQNAALQSWSGILSVGYLVNPKTQLKFSVWRQRYEREIPAALFESGSVKNQIDNNLRLFAEIRTQANSHTLRYIKTAYTFDKMTYQDRMINLFTNNHCHQSYTEIGWKKNFKNDNELLLFSPIHINWLKPQLTDNVQFQNRIAVAGSYLHRLGERLKIAIQGRIESINETIVPLGGINASYQVWHFLALRANLQRSYRAPSLNEWYYNPGGNPSLKPEKSWHQEFGYTLQLPLSKSVSIIQESSFFNRQVTDWILWFGGSIWTPHNIASVHSRGIETFNTIHYKRHNWQLKIALNTAYIRATTKKSYVANDGSIGKQIPYTPVYNGQAIFTLGYKHIQCMYIQSYTGYRYITVDESTHLSPYTTENLKISIPISIGRTENRLGLQVQNLLNRQYEVVHLRPMPGRNASLTWQTSF